MNEEVSSLGRNRSTWVYETMPEGEAERFEDNLESRLKNLGDRMAAWTDSSCLRLITEKESTREASGELARQAAGLRWIVRIAKRSQGAVRARLWLHIERTLSDLENIEVEMTSLYDNSQSISAPRPRPAALDLETETVEN
ncbi:MAG TPA: hypothetical protein VEJ67_06445 [Candidatus Cybelea sp.]|nr:hypothetical protein [Candidatus Cybelea sp.]